MGSSGERLEGGDELTGYLRRFQSSKPLRGYCSINFSSPSVVRRRKVWVEFNGCVVIQDGTSFVTHCLLDKVATAIRQRIIRIKFYGFVEVQNCSKIVAQF